MPISKIERCGATAATALRRGATIEEAADAVGIRARTLKEWLAKGREDPDGKYGAVASAYESPRKSVAIDGTGPVAMALGRYLTSIEAADDEDGLKVAVAASLARAIDGAAEIGSASALGAIPKLTAELREVMRDLAPAGADAEEWATRMLEGLRGATK